MNDLNVMILYFKKIFSSFKVILSKPILGLKFAVPVVSAPVVATSVLPYFSLFQWSLIILGILIVFDLITGIWASYIDLKKANKVTPASGSYLIQSSKARITGVKFITYALGIFMGWAIGFLFTIQEFEIHSAMRKFTLPTIVSMFFGAIEMYSIFIENFKRIGFDIIGKLKSIFSTGYKVYDIIKNNKNEKS